MKTEYNSKEIASKLFSSYMSKDNGLSWDMITDKLNRSKLDDLFKTPEEKYLNVTPEQLMLYFNMAILKYDIIPYLLSQKVFDSIIGNDEHTKLNKQRRDAIKIDLRTLFQAVYQKEIDKPVVVPSDILEYCKKVVEYSGFYIYESENKK